MAKSKKNPKYFFNPHSLSYEIVKFNWRVFMIRTFGFISGSLVFTAFIFILSYFYFKTPKEVLLNREVEVYKLELENSEKNIDALQKKIDILNEKEREIYTTIFEIHPDSILDITTNAATQDKNIIQRLHHKISMLSTSLSKEEKSYAKLFDLANKKQVMLSSIPAIQPISNKNLKYLASGFGYRIHPIYKTAKMHTGIDFSAPVGTEIYAAGHGKIVYAGKDGSGYGIHVIIDHGFGYQTLYGHMSKLKVRVGQSVKRGELIGLVGNTGLSSGPHLHYEVIRGDEKVNPVYYFHNDITPEEYNEILKRAAEENQSFD